MPKFLYFVLGSALCLLAYALWSVNSLNVNYSELESLLSQRRWMEADLYTEEMVDHLLSKAVDDEMFFGFSKLDFLGFSRTHILHSRGISCKELREIDQLWTRYSNRSFGLTAQARIALSMRKHLPTLSGQPNFTWDISELTTRLGWYYPSSAYLMVPDWYEPANRPEKANGFLPSERWVLRNAGGGKPTYTYSDALKHFIECERL